MTDSTLSIDFLPLLTALGETAGPHTDIDLTAVTGVTMTAPTALSCGAVELNGATPASIVFSPNQESQAEALTQEIQRFLNNEKPCDSLKISDETPKTLSPIPELDFVGFDVETANSDWGSICQIGLVRYQDGIEKEAVSWLCKPPASLNYFQEENTAIHGVSAEDVRNQASFSERLAEMTTFIGDLPLIAHNAQFDFTAVARACAAEEIAIPELVFGCSLVLSRSEKLAIANHKLSTVADALGVELKNHHNAIDDARAAAGILISLARRHNFTGSFIDFIHSRGFTLGSLDSAKVYPVLRDRSGAGIALQRKKFGLAQTKNSPIQESAHPTSSKPQRQPAPWAKVSTPEIIPDPNPDADPDSILYGQNVTLTGDFEPYEKGALWQRIADQGGQVGKNVTKKTTILVAGPWASITSKQKRAEDLIKKGQDLQIWNDQQLFDALGLAEQPPF